MPNICLCAIVRNEEHVLGRMLESVRNLCTHMVIVDTGSTDNTLAVAREGAGDVPLLLRTEEWVDFATARNQAFVAAEVFLADLDPNDTWLLVVDADETLTDQGFQMPTSWHGIQEQALQNQELLDAIQKGHKVGAYALPVTAPDGVTNLVPRLFRLSAHYRYQGPIHEWAESDQESALVVTEPALVIEGHFDSYRNQDEDKARRDLELLDRLKGESPSARWFLYAGLTRLGLGDATAVLDFRNCLTFSEWPEERYVARVAAAKCSMRVDCDRALGLLLAAYSEIPYRAEAVVELCLCLAYWKMFNAAYVYAMLYTELPPPSGGLHIDTRDWGARGLLICALVMAACGAKYRVEQLLQRLRDSPDNTPELNSLAHALESASESSDQDMIAQIASHFVF